MEKRFDSQHVDTWRRDGGVLIESFFTPEEIEAVRADFIQLFGRTEGGGQAQVAKAPGKVGRFDMTQFTDITIMPVDCSPALNLIGVHPELIRFAKEALRTDDVRVYQCQAQAKFTGDADYDQPFHCDFANHTLTVPSEDDALNCVTIICYFSEVTEAHGPTHYVTRPDSNKAAGPEGTLARGPDQSQLQQELRRYEKSAASPAGSIFPYTIDLYHRGSNVTAPGGHRYSLMTCFKPAGNDAIAYTAWPYHHHRPWKNIFNHATPEQLACFGVQRPGDPFWTELTLARAQGRYPDWDMTPYREALADKARRPLTAAE